MDKALLDWHILGCTLDELSTYGRILEAEIVHTRGLVSVAMRKVSLWLNKGSSLLSHISRFGLRGTLRHRDDAVAETLF